VLLADEATLRELNAERQVVLRYVDVSGNTTPEANWNGSIDNIAGFAIAPATSLGSCRIPIARPICGSAVRTRADLSFDEQTFAGGQVRAA
jgi:hypothetical protein